MMNLFKDCITASWPACLKKQAARQEMMKNGAWRGRDSSASASVLHASSDRLDADDHRILELLGRLLGATQSLQHLRLDHVGHVQVRPSHGDGLLDSWLLGQELVSSLDLQNIGDGLLETIAKVLAQLFQVVFLDGLGLVVLGNARLGLAQLNVNEVEHGLEEGPFLVHLLQQWKLPGIDELLQGKAVAEPDRQQQARLRPCEDPGDRPQGVDAAEVAALGGPAPDVHLPELGGRRVGVEEPDKDVIRALEDRLLILCCGGVRQLLHGRPEFSAGQGRGRHSVAEHCRGVALQCSLSHLSAGEVAANGFALDGEAEVALSQGASWLGLEGEVRQSATTANGATAAVEKGNLHSVLLTHLHDLLHGDMQLPGGCELARILDRVRVAQHHFLASLDVCLIPWHAQGCFHDLRGVDQILAGLEQGAHAHEVLDAANLLQEAHRQNVRGRARHGDAVGAQGLDWQLRNDLVGVKDLFDDVAAGQLFRQQRAARLNLLYQPLALLLFRPRGVGAQSKVLGDGLQGLGVAVGLLSHIKAGHADAEGSHTSDQVKKAAIGHHLVTTLNQRAVDNLQRPRQFVHAGKHFLLKVRLHLLAQVHCLHGSLGAPAASANRHQEASVRLVGSHTCVEVPVHAAASIRSAHLAPWHGRRRPHAADCLDFTLKLLACLARHAQLVEKLVHLAVVELHNAPAKQRDHLLGGVPGDIGVAIPVAAHPAADLQK
mmetsp:Transcript_17258/g.32500  ORF Transcript_17258/g.32500 Transcript_17258/m.32500 type:complete len:717 (-) Transcript_17258:820-2970(-)